MDPHKNHAMKANCGLGGRAHIISGLGTMRQPLDSRPGRLPYSGTQHPVPGGVRLEPQRFQGCVKEEDSQNPDFC